MSPRLLPECFVNKERSDTGTPSRLPSIPTEHQIKRHFSSKPNMGDLVFLPDAPVASASDYESSLSSASSFSCAGSHEEFECRWCCTNRTTNRCRGSRWFGGGEDCCGHGAADFCDGGCCGAGLPAGCALDRVSSTARRVWFLPFAERER